MSVYEEILKRFQILTYRDIVRLKEYASDPVYNFYVRGKRQIEGAVREAYRNAERIRELRREAEARYSELSRYIESVRSEARSMVESARRELNARIREVDAEVERAKKRIDEAVAKARAELDAEIRRVRREAEAKIQELNKMVADLQAWISSVQSEVQAKVGNLTEQAAKLMQEWWNEFQEKLQAISDTASTVSNNLKTLVDTLSKDINKIDATLRDLVERIDGDIPPKEWYGSGDIIFHARQIRDALDGLNVWKVRDALKRLHTAGKHTLLALLAMQKIADDVQTLAVTLGHMHSTFCDVVNQVLALLDKLSSELFGVSIPARIAVKPPEKKRIPRAWLKMPEVSEVPPRPPTRPGEKPRWAPK